MQQRVAKDPGSEMIELIPEIKNSTITKSCTKTKREPLVVCVDLVEKEVGASGKQPSCPVGTPT